jgi:hypothetical protein
MSAWRTVNDYDMYRALPTLTEEQLHAVPYQISVHDRGELAVALVARHKRRHPLHSGHNLLGLQKRLCGVWCMVNGVWCVVYGVLCVVCGVWWGVCGVWCTVYGVWYIVHSAWCVVHRVSCTLSTVPPHPVPPAHPASCAAAQSCS